MSPYFTDLSSTPAPIEIHLVSQQGLSQWRSAASEDHQRWVDANGFEAKAGRVITLPGANGEVALVLCGLGERSSQKSNEQSSAKTTALWALAQLPTRLPKGDYQLNTTHLSDWSDADSMLAYLGFGLASYRFDRYKKNHLKTNGLSTNHPSTHHPAVRLHIPEAIRAEVEALVEASYLARDIVNTPANDMGPKELSDIACEIATAHGATFKEITGIELEESFPAIHVVGHASTRDPRLVTFQWGREDAPALALVGKGVVFDTGGLSIKPTSGMVLMKKDLGGAAHVLALAQVIMTLKLDVNLRVYIPAVENAIAGNAYRPSDIINTRKGTTVEVGNTDAEGRVVLADALTYASEQGAERIIDFATLTGAARVALGEDLPPIYGRNQAHTRAIQDGSFEIADPLWHMPLFDGYRDLIRPAHADLSNTGATSMGGSVTAALFLDHFVAPDIDWYHLDIYAWNLSDRPGRPAGGEAQGIRAIWAWLKTHYSIQ